MSHYKQAGVDIDAGNELVDRIKPAVKSTNRPGVMGSIGGFGGLFDLKSTGYRDPILVAATDGVGTKLKLAIESGIFDTVGVDLVAMCVNDLIVQGAEPLFFLDYYATGKLNPEHAASVIEGIAEGCRQAGCALIGGETAEMPGMYAAKDFDLAGFAVGAVERDAILPRTDLQPGDVVLGLASSGVHSNGFSLVRHIVKQEGFGWHDKAPFADKALAEAFLVPTRIYVKSCLAAIREGGVKALAHITGGGVTENIPRILPDNLAVRLQNNAFPEIPMFSWLQEAGSITPAEMRRTFNCGIGMVLVVEAAHASKLTSVLEQAGEDVIQLGEVISKKQHSVEVV